MGDEEFIAWLKREDCYTIVEKNAQQFERIFSQCLGVTKESILLIGDYGYPQRRVAPILTGCYYLAAKRLGYTVQIVMQEARRGQDQADSAIVNTLQQMPQQSTIILNASGKIGQMGELGNSFRKFVVVNNHKFVSTTTLGSMDTFMINALLQALGTDYEGLQKHDTLLCEQLRQGTRGELKTKAGTNLVFTINKKTIRSADGNYKAFGSGGNLPAGDVYLAPENAQGVVVVDASSRNSEGSVLIQKPIVLRIENNRIVAIEGGEEAALLEKSLQEAESRSQHPERIRYLAEIGIGTNPKAKVIGSTILDEKAAGTAHVGIGSNYWFGGTNRTIIHYDQVFNAPKLKLDGNIVKL